MLSQDWNAVDEVMKRELQKLDSDADFRLSQMNNLFESIEFFSSQTRLEKPLTGLIEMQELFKRYYTFK